MDITMFLNGIILVVAMTLSSTLCLTIGAPATKTVAENDVTVLIEVGTSGEDGTVLFSMTNGLFKIDATSGDITPKTTLNYESLPSKTFDVIFSASDDSSTEERTISVTVSDVNEAPTFDDYVVEKDGFIVDVASTWGTVVGTVTAFDVDTTAPNNVLEYSIVSPADTPFAINSDGVITVSNQYKGAYLYSKAVWPLLIQANDSGVPVGSTSILIPVGICVGCVVNDE